jgi:mono/diheme cytochrome c family protein
MGLVLAVWTGLAGHPVRAADPEPVQFSRDILPILSDNCFACHGPDQNQRKADLRLDTKAGALRQETPVVVPGKSGDSELILRITSTDPQEVMPPPKSNRKLTAGQIDLLRRWIDDGAVWGKHWAYESPRRPAPPAVKTAAWPRNPIDQFILARLERDGWHPSPEAAKATLLRRVSLDLTGLPPTPEELDAFLSDNSPRAYETLVERLLDSPHYGERMAWEWLDAARYADTNGYQGDPTRAMWYWRDWVIEALNRNMPFDQFTIEQLAGDLLPEPSRAQLIATGFHRNHMINGEGGRIAEESRVDYVQDRVETTGTVWMGLTFNCCRCHDHKFDPLAQREYYQLSAYFNSIDESGGTDAFPQARPLLSLPTPDRNCAPHNLTGRERSPIRPANRPRPNGKPSFRPRWFQKGKPR